MKRGIAVFLFLLYLGTATEFVQLAKLPMLVMHYIEHAQHGDTSLWLFLHEHYMRGDVFDSDRARDLQLPFKVEIPGVWALIGDTPPCEAILIILIVGSLWGNQHIQMDPLSGIPSSIWHPPTASTNSVSSMI